MPRNNKILTIFFIFVLSIIAVIFSQHRTWAADSTTNEPRKCNTDTPVTYCEIWEPTSLNVIGRKIYGFWGLYTRSGVPIAPPIYTSVSVTGDNIYVGRNSRFGVLSARGEEIVPVSYRSINYVYGNYIVCGGANGNCGIRSSDGKILLEDKYESIEDLGGAQLRFSENGLWGIMNHNGKIVLSPQYQSISYLSYGDSINSYYWVKNQNNSFSVIDITNRKLFDANYQNIKMIGPTHFLISGMGRFGLMDVNGKMIIPLLYDDLEAAKNSIWNFTPNGYYKVKIDDKWGATDSTGKLIIPCENGPIKITNLIKKNVASAEHTAQIERNKSIAESNNAIIRSLLME